MKVFETCELPQRYIGKVELTNGETIILEEFPEYRAFLADLLKGKGKVNEATYGPMMDRIFNMEPSERRAWLVCLMDLADGVAGEATLDYMVDENKK